MDRSPKVSVVIAAYNAEAFILQTLASVLAQTYRNLEVIVVDDGSRDRTAALVDSVARRDGRVVLLPQSNRGVAEARNLAIAASSGAYVAPIDADDLWHPRKIERQVACMQRGGPETGLVYTWSICIDSEGRLLYTYPRWIQEGSVYTALIHINFIGNASVPLIRRACLDDVGGYNGRLKEQGGQGCEDWDLSLRIAERYRFGVVPAYLVGYRSVAGGMSRDLTSMERSYDLMIADVRQRYPDIPPEIYRWSQSHYYLYLAEVCRKGGKHREGLRWMHKAFRASRLTAMSPLTKKLIVKRMRAMVARNLILLLWRDHEAWLRFKRRFVADNHDDELADLMRISARLPLEHRRETPASKPA